jgi:ABC-type uncharacterized transport system substrate-binding protein
MLLSLLTIALFQTAAPQRAVAIEWLPLGMQSEAIQAFETDLKPLPLERISAYGDPAELDKVLGTLKKSPPALILAFGDRVGLEAAASLPEVPLLCISSRHIAQSTARKVPTALIVTEPDPSQIWEVADTLVPDFPALAILFTEGYGPNTALADALEKVPARGKRPVLRITVPPGNCRTDSDFEKALDALRAREPKALLYAPDDPNCSRFGNVICRLAAERRIVVLGSEATAGKGCAAALTLDPQALGKQCAAWAQHPASSTTTAPYQVVLDKKAMADQGLKACKK